MSWKYTMSSSSAVHTESGVEFGIRYVSNNLKSSLDFELVLPAGPGRAWSAMELEILKEDLWQVMKAEFEQADLRAKLAGLVRNPLIGDHFQAADVISRITGRSVSQRSVQSWLAEPGKSNRRKCPDWAVEALEAYLAEPENQKRLRDLLSYYKATAAPAAAAQPAEARPEPAAGQIADETRRQAWQNASLAELPGMLHAMEQRMNAYIDHFGKTLEAITSTVLDEGKDLDDIKRTLRLKLLDLKQAAPLPEETAARPGPPGGDSDYSL